MMNPKALDALTKGQRQLDRDGTEVGVSRQALDELVAAYVQSEDVIASLNEQLTEQFNLSTKFCKELDFAKTALFESDKSKASEFDRACRERTRADHAEHLLAHKDRQAAASRKYWVRAAKSALNGDPRELRNRVELVEAEPLDVVLSEDAVS